MPTLFGESDTKCIGTPLLTEVQGSLMKSSNKSLQLSARWPFGRVLSSRGRSRCSESESGRQLNSMLDFPKVEYVRYGRLSIGERKMLWGKEPDCFRRGG